MGKREDRKEGKEKRLREGGRRKSKGRGGEIFWGTGGRRAEGKIC